MDRRLRLPDGDGWQKLTDKSNEYMMNNLVDGVPVAFMTHSREGYRIHGLAYVEAFSPLTGMFTPHGPVSAEAEGVNFYSWFTYENPTEREKGILRGADELDGKAYVAAQVMRRRHQNKFRRAVLSAYDGRCAATAVATPDVLQAAHIDSFAKSKSHAVSNGILLRADLHLLYDAHLITILPDSGRIVVSDAVQEPLYREVDGERIGYPNHKELRPDGWLFFGSVFTDAIAIKRAWGSLCIILVISWLCYGGRLVIGIIGVKAKRWDEIDLL